MINNIGYTSQYYPNFGSTNSGFQKGLQGAVVANQQQIKDLSGYVVQNENYGVNQDSLKSALSGTPLFLAIFGGIQAFPWLKKNIKHPIKAIKADKAAFLSNPENKRLDLIGNAKNVLIEQKNKLFHKMSDAEKTALQKDRSFLGKALDLIPGYKKLRATGFGQLMGRSGAGWMLAIDGAIRAFTEIAPTFKELGVGAGIKQIGKSAASVAAGAAGWTAGEVVGSAVGAAIGTAICPGVGTAIGKFVGGFIAGTIGMHFATKGAEALTGKSELEKHNEAQAKVTIKELEKEAANSPEKQIELASAAAAKAAAALKFDPHNEEALKVLEEAEKVLTTAEASINKDTTAQSTAVPANTAGNIGQFGSMTSPAGLNIPQVPGFNGLNYDMSQYSSAIANASMPKIQTRPSATA